MTGHTLQAVGQQVVFHAAAAIFISERKREKSKRRRKIKHTEMILCKETADGGEVEEVK